MQPLPSFRAGSDMGVAIVNDQPSGRAALSALLGTGATSRGSTQFDLSGS
jgi:hypothetical protein